MHTSSGVSADVIALGNQVRGALSDELRRAPWRGAANAMAGHCYVGSEALWHLLGGSASGFVPVRMRHEGAPHWALRGIAGAIVDLTAEQFDTLPDYASAIGCGFLTREPSKRARIVIERVKGGAHA
jgi:hypothetical protein